MRLPSIENRERFQTDYRHAVHQLALADETDDDRWKRQARERVADAVRALRSIGINPIRARRL
ncbi:hypothetical protein ACFYW9_40970 [Streptomyces sp. NPDC002698]|uniref:hypothetical protein n=1 Tax=Streptomyces sp. NPDC002698 TaxID=3364660 RepID=UPI0036B0E163